MGKEKREQQDSDATNPEEKMLGKFWGIDFLFIHDGKNTPYRKKWGTPHCSALRQGIVSQYSKETGNAFFEDHHFVLHPGLQRFPLQQLQRFFDGLVR